MFQGQRRRNRTRSLVAGGQDDLVGVDSAAALQQDHGALIRRRGDVDGLIMHRLHLDLTAGVDRIQASRCQQAAQAAVDVEREQLGELFVRRVVEFVARSQPIEEMRREIGQGRHIASRDIQQVFGAARPVRRAAPQRPLRIRLQLRKGARTGEPD